LGGGLGGVNAVLLYLLGVYIEHQNTSLLVAGAKQTDREEAKTPKPNS